MCSCSTSGAVRVGGEPFFCGCYFRVVRAVYRYLGMRGGGGGVTWGFIARFCDCSVVSFVPVVSSVAARQVHVLFLCTCCRFVFVGVCGGIVSSLRWSKCATLVLCSEKRRAESGFLQPIHCLAGSGACHLLVPVRISERGDKN